MKINFKTKYFGKQFIWLNSVKSTNTFIANNKNSLKNYAVVATLNQTAGKGTKKRKFYSVLNKTLAVSFFFKNIKTCCLYNFPKACAVSLILTLEKFKIRCCKIKWFNDVVIDNEKIAGILCESFIKNKTADVVVGAGINILATKKELQNLGLLKAASIFSKTNKIIKPELFLKIFVETFEETYLNYMYENNKTKFLKLHELFERNCQTIGKLVKVYNVKTCEIFLAKAVKIALNGEILVLVDKKLTKLSYEKYSILEI